MSNRGYVLVFSGLFAVFFSIIAGCNLAYKGAFRCKTDVDCPAGQRCFSSICVPADAVTEMDVEDVSDSPVGRSDGLDAVVDTWDIVDNGRDTQREALDVYEEGPEQEMASDLVKQDQNQEIITDITEEDTASSTLPAKVLGSLSFMGGVVTDGEYSIAGGGSPTGIRPAFDGSYTLMPFNGIVK